MRELLLPELKRSLRSPLLLLLLLLVTLITVKLALLTWLSGQVIASQHILAQQTAKQTAALEMEINVREATAALFNYLETGDPAHLNRLAGRQADFEAALADYQALIEVEGQPEELDGARKLAALNAQLKALTGELVTLRQRETADFAALQTLFAQTDDLLGETIQPGRPADPAWQKTTSQVEISLNGLLLTVSGYLAEPDPTLQAKFQDSWANLGERLAEFQRLVKTPTERAWADTLAGRVTGIGTLSEGVLATRAAEKTRFVEYATVMDTLSQGVLDEQVQPEAQAGRIAVESELQWVVTAALRMGFALGGLIGLLGLGGGLLGLSKEIKERQAHERELAQERELARQQRYLSQVLQLAPYGIFTVDQNLMIQTFNRTAESLTGYAASFAIGRPYQEIVKLSPNGGVEPLPDLITTDWQHIGFHLKLMDASGKKIPIRYERAPLTDTADQIIGTIVIFHDISDVVAAERTKNEFMSMVSHELRTPLTSLKGFVTAILNGRAGEINPQQKRFLAICREQSDRLLHLINELLDLSRLELSQIELVKSRISVADLLQRTIEAIGPLAGRKQLKLELKIEPELPLLWADENKIFQVLENLLSNAVKFTPTGGQIVLSAELPDETTLLRHAQDATIVLTVADTGIGIAPEDQERIFEPFYQVENIQIRRAEGAGLGLPIVKKIVKAHGGRIEVESKLGAGSTFRLYLPLSSAPSADIYAQPDQAGPAAEARPAILRQVQDATLSGASDLLKPKRLNPLVLVVDDDPATNALLQFTLETEGYDVLTAASGPEALQLAATEQPDVITLDILMPEVNGFDVLDRLKQNPATAAIPVCIVSIIEDRAKGYRLGAIDYITKPFDSEQLVNAINAVLQGMPDRDKMRVLVVEDDPAIMELVSRTLAGNHYEIITARDSLAALEQLRYQPPHLVLLDLVIPKIDIYEFMRQVKADPRTADIPIIAVSVQSLQDIIRALRLGAEKYLIKPPPNSSDKLSGDPGGQGGDFSR